MFKIKITPKTVKSEYNWGMAIDLPPNRQRIGIAGILREGDMIMFNNKVQFIVTQLVHTGYESENVFARRVSDKYHGHIEKLPPGESYVLIGTNTEVKLPF